MNLHRALEHRTGWLFGRYSVARSAGNDPWVAVGPTTSGTGRVEFSSGIWLALGRRGFYLAREDGYERGLNRAVSRVERYANDPH